MSDKNIIREYQPKVTSLINKINRQDHYVIKNTLSRLNLAINSAQSIDYPNRYQLLEIYFDIIKDPHLKSVVKHRKERVKGLNYGVVKSNGKADPKLTDFFNKKWFKDFLNNSLDAMFYGNSLIEVLKDGEEPQITLIPRENVIPEFKMIKKDPYDTYGDINYSAKAYQKSLVDVNNNNDSRDLGDFLSVAKLILIKQEVLLNWSQYCEIFGQPIRTATTDSTDPNERGEILSWLQELGRSGYMIKNSQTTVELEGDQGKAGSSELYKELEKFLNSEVSKIILGGTMITDDGSSRSQALVHERNSYLFTKADISFIEDVVNYQLMPVLKSKGYVTAKNVEFRFKEPEIQTIDEKLKIDQFLLDNFEVADLSYFEERYGTSLTKKEIINEDQNQRGSEVEEGSQESS